MNKKQKKALVREWQAQQRADARSSLPLPPDEMTALFDMLDVELPRAGCDHTRKLTENWLRQRGHNIDVVFAWLDDNSGFCDCEVLANSEEAFLNAMGENR